MKNLQVFVEIGDSNRLSYRLLNESDFQFYNAMNSNEQVMKYAYHDIFDSIKEARAKFYDVLNKQFDDEEGTQFLVYEKESGDKVGVVDYFIDFMHPKGGVYQINYLLMPKYWGSGYAQEMSKSMISYLFDNYNIHKISALCHGDNKAFETIMTNLGMTKEGIIRKERYKNRMWVDEIKYGLLKREWEHNEKN